MMETDRKIAQQLKTLYKLERILLLQSELVPFLNSTINFSSFYDPTKVSLPEIGSLLMDGRVFRLAVHVENLEQHKRQAAHSGFCLLYVKVNRPTEFTVAVAVTGNTRGDLHLGKKGVFIDLENLEYPAEIIDIVDAPITVSEAFLEPIDLLKGRLKGMADKISIDQETQIQQTIQSPSPALMTGGVTVAALSSSLAYVTKTIVSIKLQSILIVVLAPLLILGLLSSIRAGWKLLRRDLGPILEASGWGINHPVPAPEWAANIFTNHPEYHRYPRKSDDDLLHTFERVVQPRRPFKKIVAWVVWGLLALSIFTQWESVLEVFNNITLE